MTDKFDNKGWEIDKTKLWFPEKSLIFVVDDDLFESADKNFACLFYNIEEYRMGWYGGLISLFENKHTPQIIANPKKQWFDLNSQKPLIFSDVFLFLRKLAYNDDKDLTGTPFAIFNLQKKFLVFSTLMLHQFIIQ